MTEKERIDVGYAALAVDSGDTATQDSIVVNGVAIGEGDVTIGGSGKQTLWPRETLQEAAEGLQGQPLATDMNHTADGAKAQTPVEAVVGEVTWSGYKPGVGVLYEAEVDDPDIARKIQNDRLEVSPLVFRELEPLASNEADFKATDIQKWRDLSLVVDGAAPSNEIQVGENPMQAEALHGAIEALQTDLTPPEEVQNHAEEVLAWRDDDDKDVQGMTDTGWNRAEQLASGEELSVDDVQEISAWFARHGSEEYELNDDDMEPWEDNGRVAIKGWGGPPMRSWIMDKREQLVDAGELEALSAEALKTVAGVEFDGTAPGDLDESEIPNDDYESHYLYPGDTKSESSYPVVDAEGNLHRGNVDAAWGLGARGGVDAEEHDARLMELAMEFDNPPEWADMDDAESMADISDVSEDTLVRWGEDREGDRASYGMVVDVREEGDEPLDGEIDGDVTIEPPAALIEVHSPGDDGWEATDTMVGHKLNNDTLTVVDELPDPESLAEHAENMAEVPESMKFDNPGEAMSKAEDMGFEEIHTHGEGDNTVFMPGPTHDALLDELEGGEDTQSDDGSESMAQSSVVSDSDTITMDNINETQVAVLEAADDLEEPVEALQEFAAAEQPTVVEQNTYDSMRGVLEEALSERADLKDDTIEALGFGALVDEFRDDNGDLQAEALVQNPETGEPDADAEALGDDADMDKAEALYADYQQFGTEGLKDDITEALGVSDFDDAIEVLD
jgi:hypothetical protein